MGQAQRYIQTEINTKGSLSTDCHKDMDNTSGQTELCSKEILNKGQETDTDFGRAAKRNNRIIKDIICWIKNMGMEYMIGEMDTPIKDFGWMIFVTEKEHYFTTMKLSMMVIGKTDRRSITSLNQKRSRTQSQGCDKPLKHLLWKEIKL